MPEGDPFDPDNEVALIARQKDKEYFPKEKLKEAHEALDRRFEELYVGTKGQCWRGRKQFCQFGKKLVGKSALVKRKGRIRRRNVKFNSWRHPWLAAVEARESALARAEAVACGDAASMASSGCVLTSSAIEISA